MLGFAHTMPASAEISDMGSNSRRCVFAVPSIEYDRTWARESVNNRHGTSHTQAHTTAVATSCVQFKSKRHQPSTPERLTLTTRFETCRLVLEPSEGGHEPSKNKDYHAASRKKCAMSNWISVHSSRQDQHEHCSQLGRFSIARSVCMS